MEKEKKEKIEKAVKGGLKNSHVSERHTYKGMENWARDTLGERVLSIIDSDVDDLIEKDPESYPTLFYTKSALLAERFAFSDKNRGGEHGVFLEGINDAVSRILFYLQDAKNDGKVEKLYRRLEKKHEAELIVPCKDIDAISVKYDGTVRRADAIRVAFLEDKGSVLVKTFYPVLKEERLF